MIRQSIEIMNLLYSVFSITLAVTFAAAQNDADLPVNNLDTPYLSAVRAGFRKLTKINQCANFWKVIDEKLRKDAGLTYKRYPDNHQDLIDIVDLQLLERIIDTLNGKSQNSPLIGFMQECINLVSKYRNFSQNGDGTKSGVAEEPSLQEKLKPNQVETPSPVADNQHLSVLTDQLFNMKKELTNLLEDREAKLDRVTSDLMARTKERDEVVQSLRSQLSEKDKILSENQQTINELRNKLDAAQGQLDVVQRQSVVRQNSEISIQELRLELESKRKEIDHLRWAQPASDQGLTSQVAACHNQLDSLRKELSERDQKVSQSMRQLADYEQKAMVEKNEKQSAAIVIDDLRGQVAHHKLDLETKSKELEQLRSEVSAVESERENKMRREISALGEQVRSLKSEAVYKDSLIDQIKGELSEKDRQCDSIKAQNSGEIGRLNSEWNECKSQLAASKDALSECGRSMSKKKVELDKVKLAESDMASQNRNLNALLNDKKEQIDRMKSEAGKAPSPKKCAQLQEDIKTCEDKLEKCSRDYEFANNEYHELMRKVGVRERPEHPQQRYENNPYGMPTNGYYTHEAPPYSSYSDSPFYPSGYPSMYPHF